VSACGLLDEAASELGRGVIDWHSRCCGKEVWSRLNATNRSSSQVQRQVRSSRNTVHLSMACEVARRGDRKCQHIRYRGIDPSRCSIGIMVRNLNGNANRARNNKRLHSDRLSALCPCESNLTKVVWQKRFPQKLQFEELLFFKGTVVSWPTSLPTCHLSPASLNLGRCSFPKKSSNADRPGLPNGITRSTTPVISARE
jgi:hypothetical protein